MQSDAAREILGDIVAIARRCTRYAMCRTDFLPTGRCPAGRRHRSAAYHPVGRMDLAVALHDGDLEATEGLAHVIDTCVLCQICDRQCYFVSGLRPSRVMHALASYLEARRRAGVPLPAAPEDALVEDLRAVVGSAWVSNDPAHLVPYAPARSPSGTATRPRCVVLPASAEEVAAVMQTAARHGVEVMPRGNGSSLAGAITAGVLLDGTRLSTLQVNVQDSSAVVGAGVTGWQLQRAAHRQGLRAQTAEPAACVCANIVSTNLHSLFSHAYGVGSDDVIDGEFVTYDGRILSLDEAATAGLLAYHRDGTPSRPPAVCTGMTVKLHPVPDDEDALVVPFYDRAEGIAIARELCERRLGSAVGLVSAGYAAAFLSATQDDAAAARLVLTQHLGIQDVLIVVGDRFALDAVRALCDPVLDTGTMRMLLMGLPDLTDDSLQLLTELTDAAEGSSPFRDLLAADMLPLLETVLRPTPDAALSHVDADLQPFFRRLYGRPEFSDIRWLTTFRVVSARIGRGRTFVPRIVWCPADAGLIDAVVEALARVGDMEGIKNGFGYLVPVELGRRVVVEFDYFYDHIDPAQVAAMRRVSAAATDVMQALKVDHPQLVEGREIALQGLARAESYLYRRPAGTLGSRS
jgi:hypothetical protein